MLVCLCVGDQESGCSCVVLDAGAPGSSAAGTLQLADALRQLIQTYTSPAARRAAMQPQCASSTAAVGPASEAAGGSAPQQQQQEPGLVVLVACTRSADDVPVELARCFTHELQMGAPAREDYAELLSGMLASAVAAHDGSSTNDSSSSSDVAAAALPLPWAQQQEEEAAGQPTTSSAAAVAVKEGAGVVAVDITAAAGQMVGLLPRDVSGVVAHALLSAASPPAAQAFESAPDSSIPGAAAEEQQSPPAECNELDHKQQQQPAAVQSLGLPRVTPSHLTQALGSVKARTATEMGAPQVPDVAWEDVGGLEDVKQAILDTVELPLKHR
jgi:hypothetical protein